MNTDGGEGTENPCCGGDVESGFRSPTSWIVLFSHSLSFPVTLLRLHPLLRSLLRLSAAPALSSLPSYTQAAELASNRALRVPIMLRFPLAPCFPGQGVLMFHEPSGKRMTYVCTSCRVYYVHTLHTLLYMDITFLPPRRCVRIETATVTTMITDIYSIIVINTMI